jgi:hypothetical protein
MLRLGYRDNMFYDWLIELVYFPIWWYTVGFFQTIKYAWFFLLRREQEIMFLVWLRNIFVPMYGQWDFVGRIISFIIRLIQIFFRGIIMLFYLIITLSFLFVWFALPIVAIMAILNNLKHA